MSETDYYLRVAEERAQTALGMSEIIDGYIQRPGWHMINIWEGPHAIAEGVLIPGSLRRTAHTGILGIGVLRSHWGRGLGRILMAALEARAQKDALERLEFTVISHNRRARDFYKRLGYTEEGRRRRSVRYEPESSSPSIRYGDEIQMAKWIGPKDCIDLDC
ncbi:MAG: GNAT family N-acetyltransferase [Alphaproteobacteria bacterium]|nr:GNAT family N-acetyltransferase [Alphaproteobacteria bacterium]